MEGGAWNHVSDEAKSFVKSLLQIDPKKRPTARKALRSAWMRKHFALSEDHPDASLADDVSRYSKEAKLKRLVLTMIAYNSTSEEIIQMRENFEKYDKSGEGRLCYDDFKKALAETKLNEADIDSVFSDLVRGSAVHFFNQRRPL
jgi:calcium-dependent protein kinase